MYITTAIEVEWDLEFIIQIQISLKKDHVEAIHLKTQTAGLGHLLWYAIGWPNGGRKLQK